ncbi:hypothetical protein Rsub_10418 [Raphidocelis subcapitata]|uniref:Uncharacterized protein n=1 Tax=Raphidocelis subcapitata TaxID=307507 RepID=A0A2V0PKD6_9CHLO|nr:hypothetical protein Rsub_10418 [Raphidocelis subcapitata]|eukprot:GBF97495.1 hypothetical protein Rsub_10418 [Raphidocelis subcapitata]
MDPVAKVMPLPADDGGGVLTDCAYSQAGDRMATCSSSGGVRIWDCSSTSGGGGGGGEPQLLHAEKLSEEATKVAWAPDEVGPICAVGTARGGVRVLRGGLGGGWGPGGKLACGRGAVRDLAFAPAQHGLVLAAASEDGCVYIHEGALAPDGGSSSSGGGGGVLAWTLLSKIQANDAGPCACLAWRPFTAGVPPLLLAASARGAKAWCYHSAAWQESGELESPAAAPAAALHWASTLGRPYELAAAAFGSDAAIFRLDGAPRALRAARLALLPHPGRVWRVEFSGRGNALGASVEGGGSGSPPEVRLYMPDLGGSWCGVSRVAGGADAAQA